MFLVLARGSRFPGKLSKSFHPRECGRMMRLVVRCWCCCGWVAKEIYFLDTSLVLLALCAVVIVLYTKLTHAGCQTRGGEVDGRTLPTLTKNAILLRRVLWNCC